MRGDALQTFKNNNGPTQKNLGEVLAVFPRKYVKPQLMSTAKHIFQKLVFNPANQKLVDFLDELQKLAKDAFRTCHHRAIHIRQNAATPKEINESVPYGDCHIRTDCYTHRKGIRVEWFGRTWRATNKNCEPQYCKHKCWQTQTNVPQQYKTRTSQKSVRFNRRVKNCLKALKTFLEAKTVAPKSLSQRKIETRTTRTTTTKPVTELEEIQKLLIHLWDM